MKRFMYYFLQWTWGITMNIMGAIMCLVALCCKWPIQKYRNGVEILFPNNFGGLELGMFFVRGKDCPGVCPHEYGHGIQHLWWGPLFPFVIGIPSAARYWLRHFKTPKSHRTYINVMLAVVAVIAITLFAIGFICNVMVWAIIGVLLMAYGEIIWSWLMFKELKDYEQKQTKYDDVWFEGQATRLGKAANEGKWSWL